jgi:hypothetical protein
MANPYLYLPTLLFIGKKLSKYCGKNDVTIRTNLEGLGGPTLVALYDGLITALNGFLEALASDMPQPS